jgi:alkylation response protein AidB-like acyl-CoA dehydrogenase
VPQPAPATALLASGDGAAQAELLPRLAAGELLAAVALSGPAGRAAGGHGPPGVTASPAPGGVTLDLAIGHAKQRVQFGRPIGSFQAVKHKCADMLVALEGARADRLGL